VVIFDGICNECVANHQLDLNLCCVIQVDKLHQGVVLIQGLIAA
jgi:hypothetical protein